jgi:hypothetical protein
MSLGQFYSMPRGIHEMQEYVHEHEAYVGSLLFETTEAELVSLFTRFGTSAHLRESS